MHLKRWNSWPPDVSALGLGAFLVEWSFIPENEQNNQERSHCSEKNERLERVLKNIGTISKRMERNGTGIAWKERLKSVTHSYYQERVLSWESILNQEFVLNHLEIVKDFFYLITWPPALYLCNPML